MSERFQDRYRISSARLRNWDYSAEGIYFITICTAAHEYYFGEIENKKMILSEIGSLVTKEWEKSFAIRTELFCDSYVIMPNHIHAILRINNGISPEMHGRINQIDDELQSSVEMHDRVDQSDDELHRPVETHDHNNQTDDELYRPVETHGRASLQNNSASLQNNSTSLQNNSTSLQNNSASLQNNSASPLNKTSSKFGIAYRPPKSISSFVAGFKSVVTVNARKIHDLFAWQTRFYDSIIRNETEYQRIADYIENNPANWERDEFFGNMSI